MVATVSKSVPFSLSETVERARAIDAPLAVLQKFHRYAVDRHRFAQIDGHGAAVGVDKMRP